jgi:hypothetical protein
MEAFVGDIPAIERYPQVGVFYVGHPAQGHGEVAGVAAVAAGKSRGGGEGGELDELAAVQSFSVGCV